MVHHDINVDTSEICAYNGKKSYEWEDHGLKLELPAECSARFNLKTVSSNMFELPSKVEQLSPVYLVESDGEVGGPVGLQLQHCAEIKDDQQHGLLFAVNKVGGDESSLKFELHEGQVSTSSYGKLEWTHFETALRVAVVHKKSESALMSSQIFQSSLYYQQVSKSKFMINFVVVPRQKAWEKVKHTVAINCFV